MSIRRYAGLMLGAILSVVLASSALAGQIGPSRVTNGPVGWNSPIWAQQPEGWIYFHEYSCITNPSGVHSVQFDLMHHWPAFPSTGTDAQWMPCWNDTTDRWINWGPYNNGDADYSVEYTHNNSRYVSFTYYITYPGN